MKRFILTTAFISFVAASVFSQSQDNVDEIENSEIQNENATAEINIGNRTISIEESANRTNITINRRDNQRNANRFRGQLSGVGFGFNGLLTDFWETSLNPDDEYLDINNSSKAWSIMFPSFNIGFTQRFGIVSGVGLTFNGYRFNGNNSITRGENGVIVPVYPAQGIVYKKSKLNTGYVNIPVMLQVQIPTSNNRKMVNIGGGAVGAVKLWSKTKTVWNDGGKRKEKENNDFSLNVLRWGPTARVGYGNIQIYGTAYQTPMFQKGKGPELYPYEVGIVLNMFSKNAWKVPNVPNPPRPPRPPHPTGFVIL